jgi:hypothetical protein
MKTLQEIYCVENTCRVVQFRRLMWWKTMPVFGWPCVILLGGIRSPRFEAERRMLDGLALAEDLRDVRSLINDYRGDTADRGWLRPVMGTQISVRRLKNVARAYLPGAISHGSSAFQIFQKMEP